jgi:hypothetical protein
MLVIPIKEAKESWRFTKTYDSNPSRASPADNEDQMAYFLIYFLRAAHRLGYFLAHQLLIPLPHPEDSRS